MRVANSVSQRVRRWVQGARRTPRFWFSYSNSLSLYHSHTVQSDSCTEYPYDILFFFCSAVEQVQKRIRWERSTVCVRSVCVSIGSSHTQFNEGNSRHNSGVVKVACAVHMLKIASTFSVCLCVIETQIHTQRKEWTFFIQRNIKWKHNGKVECVGIFLNALFSLISFLAGCAMQWKIIVHFLSRIFSWLDFSRISMKMTQYCKT